MLRGRTSKKAIKPSPRRCDCVRVGSGSRFDRRRQQLKRKSVSGDIFGRVVFRFRAIGRALFDRSANVARKFDFAPELANLAVFGVAIIMAWRGRPLRVFLEVDGRLRSAELAL